MNFDFAALLVFFTFLSGLIWGIDAVFLAPARKSGTDPEKPETRTPEPWAVEYARSFFPVFLIVLVLRSFIVEPFRIPSASMMPTLLIGDFILVNKYDYGLRWPVLNSIAVKNRTPERGDIIVFRYPEDPSIPFIKRVVGLPGDFISYSDKTVSINGTRIEQIGLGEYEAHGSGKMMLGANLFLEKLDAVDHEILEDPRRASHNVRTVVPPGHYFVLGDNRDNSKDSRYWGFVPDENLIGRAFMIWMNWDLKNGGIEWKRIGTILE